MDVVLRYLTTGQGMEPLTDALIAELVAFGWKEAELRQCAAGGLVYCRERDSIFSMPQEF